MMTTGNVIGRLLAVLLFLQFFFPPADSLTPLPALPLVSSPLLAYGTALATHPLATKVATATVLGVAGDAIAQRRTAAIDDGEIPNDWYDLKRAVSFGTFDALYRGGFQHVAFPWIISTFQGDGLTHLVAGVAVAVGVEAGPPALDPNIMAAAERTIFNQGLVVPSIYYPFFFAVTGFVQGLNKDQTVERAIREFPRLLRRNILFWVPVQISQFAFVDPEFQIPYLSVVGLVWTVILSTTAGKATAGVEQVVEQQQQE